jgi:16S rRNA (guanine527-N7)-methyltransferase
LGLQVVDPEEGERLLEQGARTLGISLSARQLEQFVDYLGLLLKWNRTVNLTGLRSSQEIVIKHFLDSLTPLPHLPEEARIMDLGSGAGFPGLPIKIVRPDQSIALVDASAKKTSFLKEVIRQLNLQDIRVFQGYLGKRASSFLGPLQFDIIITRAVGNPIDLMTGAYPYLPVGGKVLLMKGKEGPREISALKGEILKKGFRIEKPIELTLPFSGQKRTLVFLTKI